MDKMAKIPYAWKKDLDNDVPSAISDEKNGLVADLRDIWHAWNMCF